jgi:4-hydroxythreonine-4-phosphate dehydrogenase
LRKPIKIGITAGDPAGIGPEVTLKAVNELSGYDYIPVIIARAKLLQKQYPGLLKDYTPADIDKSGTYNLSPGKKYILDIPSADPLPVPGKGSAVTGKESRIYIDKAVYLWEEGTVDAIVTGPVNKAYIEKSGCPFTGHTEYIANLINENNPLMLMYSDSYRVLLVTTHIPVAEIIKKINAGIIYNTIIAGYRAIKSIDKSDVKLAIAGLDPHCGDEGAIGTFDMQVTEAAVMRARQEGINISGPLSADTLFTPGKWKSYNLAIAHYHDQGLIPFKMLAFESGVNVTLGLSIIRTSPDHGTAFDIAGQNKANHGSMSEAIKLAIRLAENKAGN